MNQDNDLDGLRTRWNEHADALQDKVRLNPAALRGLLAADADPQLDTLARRTRNGVIFNSIIAVLLAAFLWLHAAELRYVLAAGVLFVVYAAVAIDGALQYRAFRRIDLAGPVVTTQNQLADLTRRRLRLAKWMAILWPVLWIPLLFVALRAVFGFDAMALMSANAWTILLACWLLWASLVLAVAALGAEWTTHSPWLRRVLDELTGRGLDRARTTADLLARNERGEDIAPADFAAAAEAQRSAGAAPSLLPPGVETALQQQIARLRRRLRVIIVAMVCVGLFIAVHSGQIALLLTAAVTQAGLIGCLLLLVHQRHAVELLTGLDSATVATRLRTLQDFRHTLARMLFVLAPQLLLPPATLLLKALLGVNVYAGLGAGGLVVLALLLAGWSAFALRALRGPALAARLRAAAESQHLRAAQEQLQA